MSSLQDGRTLVDDVNIHITCSICRGYLIDARTLTHCLHSFCRSCIRRHLANKGRCPTCELTANCIAVANPRMRRDRTLQRLVYKMVPGLLQNELTRRQHFVASRQHQDMMTSAGINNKILDGRELAEYQLFTNQETFNVCLQLFKKFKEVGDELVECEPLTPRYLLCPALITVHMLKKFIRLKLDLTPSTNVELFMLCEILKDSYTLFDIAYIFKLSNDDPMHIQYVVNNFMTSFPTDNAAKADVGVSQSAASFVVMETRNDVSDHGSLLTSSGAMNPAPGAPGVVVHKKRGRKPKIRRLGRLLNIERPLSTVPTLQPTASDVVVKRKRGRPRKVRPDEQTPCALPTVTSAPSSSVTLCVESDEPVAEQQTSSSAVVVDDEVDDDSAPLDDEVAYAAKLRRAPKRRANNEAAESDRDEEQEETNKTKDVDQQAAATTNQPDPSKVIPRIKMTTVRVSRDSSAAAKWLIRPSRDTKQRKRQTGESDGGQQSRGSSGQGQRVQSYGGPLLVTHRPDVPNGWMQPSMCSANWNAAVQLLRSGESFGGDHVTPVTSQHQAAMNGMTRLPPSIYNYGHVSPSSVTINDVGSEVMLVVGADRRLSTMPAVKIGDVMHQLEQLNGEQSGRVATVRPLEHDKFTSSQVLNQRVNGQVILDRRHLDSVVLVSTIPPSCVLADSLNTHLKVTVQKSTMSPHTPGRSPSTPSTACVTMATDQRSDDCSEITSTVADDVTNSPQPHPTGKDEHHDMTSSTAICSEKVCLKVDKVVESAKEQRCSSNTSTLTTTSLTTSMTSSSSPLASNNSVSSSVSRPKPKKSLETVINLLKRPVFSDSSVLSQSVVDRVLSSLSSASDTRLSIQSDVTARSTPVTSLNHSQTPMTTPQHSRSSSNGNRSLMSPLIVDELSPSIKRLRNMCNNMMPGHVTAWQPEMVSAASQPNIPATQPLCMTSFYQPTLMNGSWISSSERYNQSTPTCLERKTNDRKQQQLSARQPSPLLARTTSNEPLGYQFNMATGQKHFNNVDWRLQSRRD